MNIHYNDPNLYITCWMCNVNQHISGFRLSVHHVFIYIDIVIHVLKIDSRNMLKDLI